MRCEGSPEIRQRLLPHLDVNEDRVVQEPVDAVGL